jgi:thymidylate synthase (FAD)
MEEIRFEEKILDFGYLKFIESWGSDQRIVEAARTSTDKGFLGWGPKCRACGDLFETARVECPKPAGEKEYVDSGKGRHCFDAPGDEKLLKYLHDNRHSTPFEFAGCVIEVQAPILVFREWQRHRTQVYNEMSARYTPLPNLNYIPTVERLLMGGGHLTKQAGTVEGAEALTKENAQLFRERLGMIYAKDEGLYQDALRMGVPKELARVHLPVGRYSRMRASTCLRNWLGFLTLRMDRNAQYEIRQFANAMGRLLKQLFPRTWELFELSHVGKWDEVR